nr:hypothetical protein [Tanacetum cinerariifolium]
GRKAESQAEFYKIDLEHAKKVLRMQEKESEPAKIQEVVDVVTTSKIIIKVVTAASDTITAASTTITVADVPIPAATTVAAPTLTAAPSRRRKGVAIRDPQETTTTSIIIYSEAKSKYKGKGFLKHFDSNMAFLQKIKEQMDEEDSRALKRMNESQEEKAAKKEDLEALWRLVKERFATTKPKNFFADHT